MSDRIFTFGDPVFVSSSSLRDYCENARTLIRPLANELRIASEELNAALLEIPSGNPEYLGVDVKFKARRVSKHLEVAAEGVEVTCGQLIRTFLSFEKNFLNAAPNRPVRRTFDVNS